MRSAYYAQMRELAQKVRVENDLTTPRVTRSDMRKIYKAHKIKLDYWPHRFKGLRGAYFNDELGPTVMIAKGLPDDPTIFTMGHELKHHLTDRDLPISFCDSSNETSHIEIGAEVFAAELIFPENDFREVLREMGIGQGKCSPEDVVHLKRKTETTLSYAGLAKRATRLGFALPGSLAKVRWQKLEEQLYGLPFYKQRLRVRTFSGHSA